MSPDPPPTFAPKDRTRLQRNLAPLSGPDSRAGTEDGYSAGIRRVSLLLIMGFTVSALPILGRGDAVAYSDVSFAALFVLGNLFLLTFSDRLRAFFSPSSVAFNYVCITLALGAVAFRQGWIYSAADRLGDYYALTHKSTITTLFGWSTISLLVALWATNRVPPVKPRGRRLGGGWVSAGLGLLVLGAVIGGVAARGLASDLIFVPQIVGVVAISLYAREKHVPWRVLTYLTCGGYLAFFQFHNKRMFVMYVLVAILIEVARARNWRFSLRTFVAVGTTFAVTLLGVAAMSVLRGHGALGATTLIGAIALLPVYFSSEAVWTLLLRNLEMSTSYFHSYNAAEHVIRNVDTLYYGMSYIKPVLVGFPREVLPGKPVSVLGAYTEEFYPAFRRIGGSFVPNVMAEMFWNVYYLSPVVIGFVFGIINRLFAGMLELLKERCRNMLVPWVAIYLLLPTYYRGGELSNVVVYGLTILGVYWTVEAVLWLMRVRGR